MRILKQKWVLNTLLILAFTMCILKVCSLRVMASVRSDLQYYGDYNNTYIQYSYKNGVWDIVHFNLMSPVSAFVWVNLSNNSSYQVICCEDSISSFYRERRAENGSISHTYNSFENVGVNFDGRTFSFNFGALHNTSGLNIYSDSPIIMARSVYDAIDIYFDGVDQWYSDQKAGDVNATIDTSNLEQLLSTSNQLGETRNTNLATITQDVGDIKNNGSGGSGLTEEDRNTLLKMVTLLTLIFYSVGLTLFRGVLRGWRRTTVK